MNTLIKNINLEEGSFIIELHEKTTFNTQLLKELMLSIAELIRDSNSAESTEYFEGLFFIYEYVSRSIIAHFNPDDLFFITDLDPDFNIYMEQFSTIIKMYITKESIEAIEDYIIELNEI